MKKIRALALLSGGLDSVLAATIVLEQGIDIIGVHFALPFYSSNEKTVNYAKEIALRLDIPFRMETMGMDYLDIIKKPKYGYGAGINPCIDCKIYMLKHTKRIAEEIGADFILTGEVLNQRPMSQHRRAMYILERDSGLQGKILRPLSAKHLPETIAERKGWVDREKLLSIRGRTREIQFSLAKEKGIDLYAPVAGGCILTDKFFSIKMKDLLNHKENVSWDDVLILNFGRHFRFDENKIIVGRNEKENKSLLKLKCPVDFVFELPDQIPGPTTLLQGEKDIEAINLAAALTIRYSDIKQAKSLVLYGEDSLKYEITGDASILNKADFYNISTGKKE